MITITFEPYDGYLTEEECDQIIELLNTMGCEIDITESEDNNGSN